MADHPDVGRRVRLLYCADDWTKLVPGECGTITLVDAMDTRHIHWDKGNRLGLVPGVDRWEYVS